MYQKVILSIFFGLISFNNPILGAENPKKLYEEVEFLHRQAVIARTIAIRELRKKENPSVAEISHLIASEYFFHKGSVLRSKIKTAYESLSSGSAAAGTTTPLDACAECREDVTKIRRCGACKKEVYCSKICQVTAWPEHKKSCVKK